MIISDSSPLIHLTRLGKINYLLKLKSPLFIPKAVYTEVIAAGKKENRIEAQIIEKLIEQGKIIVKPVKIDDSFVPSLGQGEREALELANREKLLLLVDDRKARNIAHHFELQHQTTILTILELLIAKMIDLAEYKGNLKKYAEDSWVSADIIQEFLEKGEKLG